MMAEADGEKLWREGHPREAAEAYLSAAQSAVSSQAKAKAYAMAGTMFGLVGDSSSQRESKLKASEIWIEIADIAANIDVKVDAYWQAFIQFVAIKDATEQMNCILRLVEAVCKIKTKDRRWNILKRLLDTFPDAGGVEGARYIQSSLANIRVEQFHTASAFEQKIKFLEEALDLYRKAKDARNEQKILSLLRDEYCKRGTDIESAATNVEGFKDQGAEDQARTYDTIAPAYLPYCSAEEKRCRRLAAELRAKAALEAKAVPGLDKTLAELEKAFFAEEAHIEDPVFFHSSTLGIFSNQDEVVVRSHGSGLGYTKGRDFHHDFDRFFIGYCKVNITDALAVDLLNRLLTEIGETTSYCPTPGWEPQWITTTKYKKIALALIAGTLTGTVSGLASGGMDLKAILIGILGAHASILVNLISGYLVSSENRTGKGTAILKSYLEEPTKVFIIVELNSRPQTVRELCNTSGLSENKIRQIIRDLKKDDVVVEKKGKMKPVQWELRHPLHDAT